MSDIKYCKMCGTVISRVDDADWYSHMSVKYCPNCRKKSDREKAAERMKNMRRRTRENNKLRKERNELLEQENELLRQRIIKLRELVEH